VLKEVLRLHSGDADIKDGAITVSGIAADEAAAQSIRAALRAAVPSGFKLTHQISVKESSPPVKSEAAKDAPSAKEVQASSVQSGDRSKPQEPAALPKPFPSLELESPPPIPPARDLEPPVQLAKPIQPPPLQPAPAPAPEAKIASAPEPRLELDKLPPIPPARDLLPPSVPSPPKQASPEAVVEPKTATVAVAPPAAEPGTAPAPDVCARELARVDVSGHILFGTDSAKLDPASFDLLERLAAAARSCNGLRIAIEGHADTEGSAQYNKRLSVRRARAVQTYLINAGMASRQLETIGYGFNRPVAPNDTAENMAKNRRIEFVIRR
jgi:outer membrane protein OmpA-like peptidoglycan-associated protein